MHIAVKVLEYIANQCWQRSIDSGLLITATLDPQGILIQTTGGIHHNQRIICYYDLAMSAAPERVIEYTLERLIHANPARKRKK